jgi:Bacterial PH domain
LELGRGFGSKIALSPFNLITYHAKEPTAVTTESRTTTPDLQTDLSMVNHLIVEQGVPPGATAQLAPELSASPAASLESSEAMEAEETIWEGRYSIRNFLGRAIGGCLLILASIALAIATWGFGLQNLAWLSYASGVVAVVYWLVTGFKFLRIRRNHHYWLTTRRLFLTTGVFQRRVDQVELVRIKDLFTPESG